MGALRLYKSALAPPPAPLAYEVAPGSELVPAAPTCA
jgi:hypothetical protein